MITSVRNPYLDENLKLERWDPERVRYEPLESHAADLLPQEFRSTRVLHGAVVAAVAQEAAWQILREGGAVTTGMTISFLHPTTLNGGQVLGTGEIMRVGDTLAVSRGDVHQGGRLVASAVVNFRVRRPIV